MTLKRVVISFHSRVSRAEGFITELQKVSDWISDEHRPSGDLHADFVSGNMPAGKRLKSLDRPQGAEGQRARSAEQTRCLGRGVMSRHWMGLRSSIRAAATSTSCKRSGARYAWSPEKKTGTIILPVFLKSAANAVSAIEASNQAHMGSAGRAEGTRRRARLGPGSDQNGDGQDAGNQRQRG